MVGLAQGAFDAAMPYLHQVPPTPAPLPSIMLAAERERVWRGAAEAVRSAHRRLPGPPPPLLLPAALAAPGGR
eukprot:2222604-Rhodomonas_salina.1